MAPGIRRETFEGCDDQNDSATLTLCTRIVGLVTEDQTDTH